MEFIVNIYSDGKNSRGCYLVELTYSTYKFQSNTNIDCEFCEYVEIVANGK